MTLLFYFIFVHLILLIPGYTLVKNVRILEGKSGLELCASYVIGMVTLASIAMAGYMLHIPRFWLHSISWVLVSFGIYFFIKQRLYRNLRVHRVPLLALVGMSLLSCAFINLSFSGPRQVYPDPVFQPQNNYNAFNVKVLNIAQTPANDNYIPYRQAQFIINRSDPAKDSFIDEWGVHFFQRTPLMGAVTAGFFNLAGVTPPIAYTWSPAGQDPHKTYLQFQIIAQILNSLLVLPAFFLLIRLFNRRTALAALLFIIPSQFFLYNSFFSWPKSLVAFLILFSWMLLFEKRMRYVLAAGLTSGVAYLAHDLAILYIGTSFLLLLYWRRWRDMLIFGALNILLALPWLFTSIFIYKKTSSFALYPLSLHDIPQVSQKKAIIHEFVHTSPLRILTIKLESFYYLISPYQLIHSEGGQALNRRLWSGGLYNVPGAAGFGLIVPIVLGAINKIRNLPFWIMAIAPILFCTIVIGWPRGLGALHFAEASVVLCVGLATWWLTSRKNPLWLMLAFAVNTAQLIFFILFSYGLHIKPWLTHPRDLAFLTIIISVVVLCGIAMYLVGTNKNHLFFAYWDKMRRQYR